MSSNGHISFKLLTWYKVHKRDLPWRSTRDPYIIWLSEILLQQTRVAQGLPYFEHFVNKYPTIEALAQAPLDEVLKMWQGLGYYSRAHNLHQTAQKVAFELEGRFPTKFNELIKLKGIGAYTAAAISSIASGEKQAVVDGNVYRVLSRLFGIDTPINQPNAYKIFCDLSFELMQDHDPGTYNQAIMELGAVICKPRNPACSSCPISDSCFAAKEKTQTLFPVKLPAKAKSKRFFNYVVLKSNGQIMLQKRGMQEIWKGMHEPLLIESDSLLEISELGALLNQRYKVEHIVQYSDTKHLLTHRTLHIRFFSAEIMKPNIPSAENWINISDLAFFALPKPVSDFFDRNGENL